MSYFLKSWIADWFKECFWTPDYKKLYLEEYKKHTELKYWTQKYMNSNNELLKYMREK